MDMKLQSIRKYQSESTTEKHIIAGKAAERKRMVKMKKKAVVFWITAASVAAISTVLYIRSLLADKKELQKELKDHNNDDMDEYLYDSLKDNGYLV